MRDKVSYLPRWKENATAEEFFLQCAQIAAKDPKRCLRVFVTIREEEEVAGEDVMRHDVWRHNCDVTEAMAMIEFGKMKLVSYATGE